MSDSIAVRGMYRLHMVEDKDGDEKIVGDSGWQKNTVVNDGFLLYLVSALGSIAGKTHVTHVAVGTGTAPGAAATTLNGEMNHGVTRPAVTAATVAGSKGVLFTATFASANSYNTASIDISNIGLFGTATSAVGTLFSGAAYASSSWATNQSLNVSYQINFS